MVVGVVVGALVVVVLVVGDGLMCCVGAAWNSTANEYLPTEDNTTRDQDYNNYMFAKWSLARELSKSEHQKITQASHPVQIVQSLPWLCAPDVGPAAPVPHHLIPDQHAACR